LEDLEAITEAHKKRERAAQADATHRKLFRSTRPSSGLPTHETERWAQELRGVDRDTNPERERSPEAARFVALLCVFFAVKSAAITVPDCSARVTRCTLLF